MARFTRLYEQISLEGLPPDWTTTFQHADSFVKRELCNVGKLPHLIYSRTDLYNVLVGPVYFELSHFLYSIFPCIVQPLSPDQLAARIRSISDSRGNTTAYSFDATRWDSSITEQILLAEHRITDFLYGGLLPSHFRLADFMLLSTPTGETYTVDNFRSTGQQNTSIGNAVGNLVVYATVCFQRDWHPDYDCLCVKGDDLALIAPYWDFNPEDYIESAYRHCGISFELMSCGDVETIEMASSIIVGHLGSRQLSKSILRSWYSLDSVNDGSLLWRRQQLACSNFYLNRHCPVLGPFWYSVLLHVGLPRSIKGLVSIIDRRRIQAALQHVRNGYNPHFDSTARSTFQLQTGIPPEAQREFELACYSAPLPYELVHHSIFRYLSFLAGMKWIL
jgi:hypothetical protein